MIDNRACEKTIQNGLQAYLNEHMSRQCNVVLGNSKYPAPQYPYLSYNITTPIVARGGTWEQHENNDQMQLLQRWSFTAQSDSVDESIQMAMLAYEYFDHVGRLYLSDNGIVVVSVSDINNRDNMLSIAYEHRNGFDVTFRMTHTVERPDAGQIETVEIKNEYERVK